MSACLHRFPGYDSHQGSRPGVDAAGNVYLRVYAGNDRYQIWRVSPDGKQAGPIVQDCRSGGALSEDGDRLVVAPNGTIWTLGSCGKARAFAPDGSLLFVSPESRKEDEARARRRAEKLANDEDPD
jgi:hypothetical protein